MRFQFDDELVSERVDPLQAFRRFERRQREEEIYEPMPSGQAAVHSSSIEAVPQAFLPSLEGEVSPHDRSWWEKSLDKHVCAEVHMMMAVEPLRVCPVDAAEFVELGCHHILKGIDQSRMKNHLGEAVSQKVSGDLLLAFRQP